MSREVCTCDLASTFEYEVEGTGRPTLADYDVFRRFVEGLAHRADQFQLAIQDRIAGQSLPDERTMLAEYHEEVLGDTCL